MIGCLMAAGLLLSPNVAMASTTTQTGDAPSQDAHPPYSLLQMNICSSGVAGCFARTQCPKVLGHIVERFQANDVNAVPLREACSGAVAPIAAGTWCPHRFATAISRVVPLHRKSPR